jgi:hypothetical protein
MAVWQQGIERIPLLYKYLLEMDIYSNKARASGGA